MTEIEKIHSAAKQGVKLGRSSFKISLDSKVLMVKYQPKCRSLPGRLTRRLVGGSLPYLNEPRINALLQSNTFADLDFPLLISNHSPCYCVYAFIRNSRKLNGRLPQDKSYLINAMLELHLVRGGISKPPLEKLLFSLLERPVYRMLRWAAFSELRGRAKLKIVLLATKYSLTQKKLPAVLLHNDLNWSNVILKEDGKPVLVDFEDAIFERKWVLSDLVDLLFDPDDRSLGIRQLEDAWRQLAGWLKIEPETLKFKQQVRLCLIRTALRILASRSELSCDRKKLRSFLELILNDKEYNLWFETRRLQNRVPVVSAVPKATAKPHSTLNTV